MLALDIVAPVSIAPPTREGFVIASNIAPAAKYAAIASSVAEIAALISVVICFSFIIV